MGKVGDPFLLRAKTREQGEKAGRPEPGKPAKRHKHSFRDPRMPCIVGRDRSGARSREGD